MSTIEKICFTLFAICLYLIPGVAIWLIFHNVEATYFYAGMSLGAFAYGILPKIWN